MIPGPLFPRRTAITVRFSGMLEFISSVEPCRIMAKGVVGMELNEGLAASIRAIMKQKHMSLTEFAEELEISRSTLHTYTKGEGNPSTATINHIAQRLGISSTALTNGLTGPDHWEVALLLLDTIQNVAELPEEVRLQMAELFLEMVKLWNKK